MKSVIKDLILYQLIFLFRYHALEKEEEIEWHKEAISDFFGEVWKKVNPEKRLDEFLNEKSNILFPFSYREVENLYRDIRIFNSGVVKSGGRENLKLESEIRAYDDVIRIEISYLLEGKYSSEIFSELKKELLNTSELREKPSGRHVYIGETYYPAVQIEKCGKSRAKEIASEIMKYLGYPKDEFHILNFSWGYLIIHSAEKEKPLILYWDEDENKWQVAKLVHKIFPFLLLNRYKFFYIQESYPGLQNRLNEQERKINDLCIQVLGRTELKGNEDIKILKKMEANTIELSKALASYVQDLAILKGYIREIEILLEGIKRLLGEISLSETDFWMKDIEFTYKQLNMNLNFYWLTKEAGDSALDFIHKIVVIRSSQWNRFTQFLVSIISAWAIVYLFPTNLWVVRISLLVIITFVFYFLLSKSRFG